MKITIYELLGLVKDDKAPKKIKYDDKIWAYDNNSQDYCNLDKTNDLFGHLFNFWTTNTFINNEVETIEEEPKPITKESIEALGYACGEIRKLFENGWNKSLENKPLIEELKKLEKIDFKTLNTQKEKK